jgi:hypothetical protein
MRSIKNMGWFGLPEAHPMVIAVIFTLLMFFAWLGIGLVERRLRDESDELREARAHLDKHFDALETLLGDPRVTASMKSFLFRSSDVFASKEFFDGLANREPVGLSVSGRRMVEKFVSDLEVLQRTAPDLASRVDDVFTGGYTACALWAPKMRHATRKQALRPSHLPEKEARREFAERLTALFETVTPNPA